MVAGLLQSSDVCCSLPVDGGVQLLRYLGFLVLLAGDKGENILQACNGEKGMKNGMPGVGLSRDAYGESGW